MRLQIAINTEQLQYFCMNSSEQQNQEYIEDDLIEDDDYMVIEDDPPGMTGQQSSYDPNKPFKIIPSSQVLKSMQKSIDQLNELFCLGSDWSLLFFHQCRWNLDKCKDQFFNNQTKLFKQVGYNANPYLIEDKPGTCQICLQACNKFAQLNCGHQYCVDCWKSYINECLSKQLVFNTCMKQGCKTPMLRSFVEQFLQNTPSRYALYLKCLGIKFVEVNSSIKFCPGADCDKCLQSNNITLKEVQCSCGTKFCFKCKEPVHRPCDCQDTRSWKDLVEKEQANAQWLSINTKVCPWCNKHVQRSAGCNFMSCTCGKSFCYVCSRPWEPDHKDHFVCNIYKPGNKDKDNLEKEKSILQKLNFYCEKYLSNQYCAGKLKEMQEKAQQIQQDLFKILGIEFIATDFIKDVYRFAIQACDVLKWSYAYRYFMNDKSKFIDLFEGRQSDFEKFKQNLIFKLETKFLKFIESLRQDLKAKPPVPIDVEARRHDFAKIKEQIMSFFKSAQTYMNSMISSIENEMT